MRWAQEDQMMSNCRSTASHGERILSTIVALVVLLSALWLVHPDPASAQPERIGVIDSQRIFSEYQRARDAEALYQEEYRQWQKELEDMEREILAQQEKIRSQSLLLSKEKLDEMQAALDQQINEYEGRKQDLFDPGRGKAVARSQELSAPINDQISTIVEQIGAEGKYALIIDAASVNVVYVGEGIDLTDQVLEELDKAGQ
jgi:Skp family chaperone for outer membrane proteins